MSLPSFQTLCEVILLAVINYGFIRHLQATRGGGLLAGFIMVVIGVIAIFAFVINFFDLPHIKWIADRALPGLVFALLVIFQPELRLAISRVGSVRIVRLLESLFGAEADMHPERVVDAIVSACQRMSKKRIGALIVVQRREGIEGFATAGTLINSDVSAALLETIFYKGSPLHDGAVLIINGRAMYAACHLPLSETASLTRDLGTRHCAALGISEESDALTIVVSEETGRISVARDGELNRDVTISELRESILEGIVTQLETPEQTAERDEARVSSAPVDLLRVPDESFTRDETESRDKTPEEVRP